MYVVGDKPKKVSVLVRDLERGDPSDAGRRGYLYALGTTFRTTLVPGKEIYTSPSVASC